jgi:tetratricopeptide (TPR) repeat protein
MRKFLLIFIAALTIFSVQGCENNSNQVNPEFAKARKFFSDGYYFEAEKGFESYLQNNPQGKKRLQAWNKLVSIASDVRQDPERGASILEAMYLEFGHDSKKAPVLKRRVAAMYIRCGKLKAAVENLEKSLEFPDQPQAEMDKTRMMLARTYRELRNYDLAILIFGECADYTDNIETKSEALFEKAQTLTLIQARQRAMAELENLVSMHEVSAEIHSEAAFLLADLYEQQDDYKKALELLKEIKDTYPNPNAIELRISYIEKEIK